MAQTFDIRFARSAGLAGLFEAPANSFRWKGAGKLSIDPQGISIAEQRGLLTLFSKRSRRVAADELTQVYREGDALRLEFGSDDKREILPIWATGNAAAAEIVKLLPTIRTVELEHATQAPRNFRVDRRTVAWLAFTAALVVGALVVSRQIAQSAHAPETAVTAAVPVEVSAQQAANPAAESTAALPIGGIESQEGIEPFQPGTAEHGVAARQQEIFELELATLRARYFELRGHTNADALERLEPAWWAVTFRIDTSEEMSGPAFLGFREAQLAVISSWRAVLALHAAGLRLNDERFIVLSEKQRDLAELYEQLVRMYVP
jgi:hypothetical protein